MSTAYSRKERIGRNGGVPMEMKVYHCTNPEENPIPAWLRESPKKTEPAEIDFEEIGKEQVRKFKECPDSFFPSFYGRGKISG